MVLTTARAKGGRGGHRFTVEDVMVGHWAMDGREGVGVVRVAGRNEKVVASPWSAKLAELVGSGDKVKDREIVVGTGSVCDIWEAGGDGRVDVGASEECVAFAGGVGEERRG